MILLLGARGYIGQAFARELRARGERFIPLSRATLDYTRFELLFEYVRKMEPDFIINAGGIWGNPNVDACESARVETFQANTLLPQTIASVCGMTNTPWGHVSSACIYSGAKVYQGTTGPRTTDHGTTGLRDHETTGLQDHGTTGAPDHRTTGPHPSITPSLHHSNTPSIPSLRVERDIDTPRMRRLFAEHPEYFVGFNETDEPNFCFRSPPANYVAGTKALAEERLRGSDRLYIWRIGRPFSHVDEPGNMISRLLSYPRIFEQYAAVSHLDEFVRGCLELVERGAPFGTYNVTNQGAITTRDIAELIERKLMPGRRFEFWASAQEFYGAADRAPRSSCIIDSGKLARMGIRMRSAREAVEGAIDRWVGPREQARQVRTEPVLRVV